jgi:hypothetical protein
MNMLKMFSYLLIIILSGIQSTFNPIRGQNWPKIYGDSFDGLIKDVSETYDKGFLLTAFIYDYQGVPEYGWIVKTDINGNVIWDKKYGNGSYRNWFSGSFKTMDDGLIISGITNQYSTGDRDPLFIKTNLCGEIDWCKVLSCPDQNFGTDVVQVDDGSYIGLLTYYGTGETYARISLVKMDQNGEPVWIQRLAQEDSLINNEEGLYLYLTSNNNYLVSGYAYHPGSYPFWILIDTSGVQIWDLFWDSGYGEAHQVVEKDSGIFYSSSYAIGENGIQSPLIFKFNKYGNLIGQYNLMGDTIVMGSCLPLKFINDTTIITGLCWKKVYFPIDEGFAEVFITDTLGHLKNRRMLLTEYANPANIILSTDQKILVSGNFVVDGNWDIYLWKMNSDLEDDTLYTQPLTYDSLCPYQILSDTMDLDCSLFVKIDEIPSKEEYESTIKISPNPARDWITMTLPDNVSSGNVGLVIYNIFGQEEVRKDVIPSGRMISMNISNLSSGIYLAVGRDRKNRIFKGKFIVAH